MFSKGKVDACISVQTIHGVTALFVHISEHVAANQNMEICLHARSTRTVVCRCVYLSPIELMPHKKAYSSKN